jgi:hypothetical protein
LSPAEIRVPPAEIEVPPAEIEVREAEIHLSKAEIGVRPAEFQNCSLRTVLSRVTTTNQQQQQQQHQQQHQQHQQQNKQLNMPRTIAMAKRGRPSPLNLQNGNIRHPSSAAGLVSMLWHRQQQHQQQQI